MREGSLARWIAHEFEHLNVPLRCHASVGEALAALVGASRRTSVLLVFLDELTAAELREVLRLRELGWTGELVAISRYRMAPTVRRALGVNRLLTPPFVQDLFGDILAELRARVADDARQPGVVAVMRMTTGSSSR